MTPLELLDALEDFVKRETIATRTAVLNGGQMNVRTK